MFPNPSLKASEWKKPTEIMRVHRLKKRPTMGAKLKDDGDSDFTRSRPTVCNHNIASVEFSKKRRNPFGCSSPLKHSFSDADVGCSSPLKRSFSDADKEIPVGKTVAESTTTTSTTRSTSDYVSDGETTEHKSSVQVHLLN